MLTFKQEKKNVDGNLMAVFVMYEVLISLFVSSAINIAMFFPCVVRCLLFGTLFIIFLTHSLKHVYVILSNIIWARCCWGCSFWENYSLWHDYWAAAWSACCTSKPGNSWFKMSFSEEVKKVHFCKFQCAFDLKIWTT